MPSIAEERGREVRAGSALSSSDRGAAPGRVTATERLSRLEPREAPPDVAATALPPVAAGAYCPDGLGDTGDVRLTPGALLAAPACEPDLVSELDRDIEVAVFTTHGFPDQGTFAVEARCFADEHRAVGLAGGRLVVGGDAAMGAASPAEVVRAVQDTIAAIRAATGRPATIATLALFTHGLTDRLNWAGDPGSFTETAAGPTGPDACGLPTTDAAPAPSSPAPAATPENIDAHQLVAAITSALGADARVVLYACLTGSTYSARDVSRAHAGNRRARAEIDADHDTGGEGSFADVLRDELDADGSDRTVWAHRTTAHTTGNPTWRAFAGQQAPGERASTDLFGGAGPVWADWMRGGLASAIARGLGLRARFDEAEKVHRLMRGSRIVDGEFGRWIAREMPFLPDDLRARLAGDSDHPDPALVAWFIERYRAQRGQP